MIITINTTAKTIQDVKAYYEISMSLYKAIQSIKFYFLKSILKLHPYRICIINQNLYFQHDVELYLRSPSVLNTHLLPYYQPSLASMYLNRNLTQNQIRTIYKQPCTIYTTNSCKGANFRFALCIYSENLNTRKTINK